MTIEAYENTLPLAQRVLNGQYYTPAAVCDLMLALTLSLDKSQTGQRILEPSCGVGAFLSRALNRFNQQAHSQHLTLNRNHLEAPQFVGVELDPQAAELTRQSLQPLFDTAHFEILTEDFLKITAETVGHFDIIIGNPPYVRQEYLAQSKTLDKQAAIQYLKQQYAEYTEHYPEQKILFNKTADLYIWFFLQAATLLKPGGKLAFITSNSWLNASYGQAFRQFLLHHFHIHYLMESACERWFKDAAVNAVIIVLEKKSEAQMGAVNSSAHSSLVQILRFRQPVAQWLPNSADPHYWQQLHAQIEQIATDDQIETKQISTTQLQSCTTDHNWALPLRAPQALLALLECNDLWLRLDQLGTVRYPIKTGINRFFYLSRQQAQQWSIEDEFLFPVIRSARKIKRYAIYEHECDEFLFACPDTLQQLTEADKINALAYIEWGSQQTSPPRQKRLKPIPWPQVPSVQSGTRPWYSIQPLPPAHLLCNRFIDRRFFFALCHGNLIEDQTFYGLTLNDTRIYPPELVAALLNCSLSFLLLELKGRTSLGEGVLQYARCDMAAFPMLNPALFSQDAKEALMRLFTPMSQRSILGISDELQQEDRIALDRIVLDRLIQYLNLNLTTEQFRTQITAPLLNRCAERRILASCFRKKSKSN
jgi:methylase of polypeptide subunit release factors